jgi:hypothetical protein
MYRLGLSLKHPRIVIMFLMISATLCARALAGAVDLKQPLRSIRERLKPAGVGEQPAWERVLIWDEALGQKRGVRVALMAVRENEQNEPVDRRMTIQMKGYMLNFCEQVITVPDVEDADLRDQLDNVLKACINQWKHQGRIEPETVAEILPEIAIDAVVLFQRSLYDQGWRGDRKIFRVGLVGAAFAVDTGEMIFLYEAIEESPWSGMQSTVSRVERLAIQSFLQRLYERLVEIAQRIDAEHTAVAETARRAEEVKKREKLMQLAREEEDLRRLTQEASAVLLSATEPPDLISDVRRVQESIAKSLQKPSAEQTDEDLEARRKAAAELRGLLAQEQVYSAEREQQSRLPPPDRPVAPSTDLPGSEQPLVGGLLIDFSGVVIPTPTPGSTPTPRDYVAPGLFDLPRPRPRRTPLPPLRPILPTPTPTPRPQSIQSVQESPSSATSAIPAPGTAGGPFPATATVADQSGTVSPATLPVVPPPSEDIIKDIEALRRRRTSGNAPGLLKLGEAGSIYRVSGTQGLNGPTRGDR